MTNSPAIDQNLPAVTLAYYQIPEPNFAALEEKIDKLSRRSKRFKMGEITLKVVGVKPHESNEYNVLDIELNGAEPIVSGWHFVASISHDHETGNILRYTPPFTAASVDQKYRTTAAICEHCKLSRQRKDTYVVRHRDTNEEKQVGRTCLTEFFHGANPHNIAEYAEMLGNIGVLMEEAINPPSSGSTMRKPLYFNLKNILIMAASVIRVNKGFVSGGQAYSNNTTSTATFVKHILWTDPSAVLQFIPTPEDEATAIAAIEWGANVEANVGDDYLWNVRVLSTSELVTAQQIGLAVSIVGVYLRNRLVAKSSGGFLGTKDERLTFDAKLVAINPTQFSHLHIFQTPGGDTVKWFNKGKSLDIEIGESSTFTGTVVDHNEFKGQKATIVTRLSVGAPAPAKKLTPAETVADQRQFDQVEVPF